MESDSGDARNLSRRIASGDTEAFAVFYELWFDRCVAETRRRTGLDEAACLDVVQDAMLRVATRMPVFETQEELERWMRRVLLNGARDRIRAETRRIRRESQAPVATVTESDRDSLAELNVRLAEIDKESAQLLRRRYDLGWTLEQIGRELGLRPGAVDGRIRRILKKLRGDAGSQQ